MKHICKKFSVKKWAVSSVEDQCKIEKMNLIERKTCAERPQTVRSEQNYRCVTEVICSQVSKVSSRSRREIKNLTAISLSSGCCRSCHGHKHAIANVFSRCVKMLLGCFDCTVILLCKSLNAFIRFWIYLELKEMIQMLFCLYG